MAGEPPETAVERGDLKIAYRVALVLWCRTGAGVAVLMCTTTATAAGPLRAGAHADEGREGPNGWKNTDALHCRTHGMPIVPPSNDAQEALV